MSPINLPPSDMNLAATYFSIFVVSLSLYLKYTAAPIAIRATVDMIIRKPVIR